MLKEKRSLHKGFLRRDASMKALWTDRQIFSESQSVPEMWTYLALFWSTGVVLPLQKDMTCTLIEGRTPSLLFPRPNIRLFLLPTRMSILPYWSIQSLLNCLSFRSAYQSLHSPNASTLFNQKHFSPLIAALSHHLLQNRLPLGTSDFTFRLLCCTENICKAPERSYSSILRCCDATMYSSGMHGGLVFGTPVSLTGSGNLLCGKLEKTTPFPSWQQGKIAEMMQNSRFVVISYQVLLFFPGIQGGESWQLFLVSSALLTIRGTLWHCKGQKSTNPGALFPLMGLRQWPRWSSQA